MTQPTSLPADIAAALAAYKKAAEEYGWTRSWPERKEWDEARASLEAVILAHLSGGGWKPMSEAPKDGTEIFAWSPSVGRVVVHWSQLTARWLTDDGRGCFSHGWFNKWAPLPSPPATDLGRSALAEDGRGE